MSHAEPKQSPLQGVYDPDDPFSLEYGRGGEVGPVVKQIFPDVKPGLPLTGSVFDDVDLGYAPFLY